MSHDKIVQRTLERIVDNYDDVWVKEEYSRRGLTGEFDILTYRNGRWNYYEIKSNNNEKARTKAKKQFQRAARAFPEREWNFIYVTPQLTYRYAVVRK